MHHTAPITSGEFTLYTESRFDERDIMVAALKEIASRSCPMCKGDPTHSTPCAHTVARLALENMK